MTLSEQEASLRVAEQILVEAQHRARDAAARRDELTAQRDAMRESLSKARDRVSQTTYKIDSLRTLLSSLESQEEEVRRAILELIPNVTAAAEAVRAAEGFEAALDALLREVSKAIVVDDRRTASAAVARLRQRGAGRGAFITLDYQRGGEGSRRGDASNAVVGEGSVADAVREAIPEAYIVGDLEQALERARERPYATFVTLDGDIVRGPLVIGGKTEGATPGVFSLKRQLSDLQALLGSEETRATGIAAELQKLEEDLHAADDARILAEERMRVAETDLHDRRNERERAGVELDRFERDLQVASDERTLYVEEKEQLVARRNAAVEDLQRLEGRERQTHDEIRRSEDQLTTARAAFEQITDVASKARVDVEAATGNVTAVQREFDNLSRVVITLASRRTQLQNDIDALSRKQQDTAKAADEARIQLDQSSAKLQELAATRAALETEVAELERRAVFGRVEVALG